MRLLVVLAFIAIVLVGYALWRSWQGRWRIEPREINERKNGIFLVRGERSVLVHKFDKEDDVEHSYGIAQAKRMRRDLN